MKSIDEIYKKLPVWSQTLLLNAYAGRIYHLRGGNKLVRIIEELKKHEKYSREELIEYQNEKLKVLIKHAYTTVAYYKQLMDGLKLKPNDINSINDLQKLPVLTKKDIRCNFKKLISSGFKKRKLIAGHTSGTTGTPLEFLWDKYLCLFNEGVDWRQKRWAGLSFGEKYAVALGRTIVPVHQKNPPFWRMNHIHKQLWLSSFHMSEENLNHYFNKLESYMPKVLEGYPSTMFILAKYLEKKKTIFPVKAVLTSSETLLPLQRELIERVFDCKVFDFYGLAERVIFATECSKHCGLHLNSDFGITEVVDSDGKNVPENKPGFLVGTSLHNFGMPFIRYQTSDFSSIDKKQCACGCAFPLMSNVTTKAEDIVVLKDGRLISSSILTHPFKPLHNIKKSQIIQYEHNEITIKLVKRAGYSKGDSQRLLRDMHERLGDDVNITLDFVESIPSDPSGKFRWVISKVPLNI